MAAAADELDVVGAADEVDDAVAGAVEAGVLELDEPEDPPHPATSSAAAIIAPSARRRAGVVTFLIVGQTSWLAARVRRNVRCILVPGTPQTSDSSRRGVRGSGADVRVGLLAMARRVRRLVVTAIEVGDDRVGVVVDHSAVLEHQRRDLIAAGPSA